MSGEDPHVLAWAIASESREGFLLLCIKVGFVFGNLLRYRMVYFRHCATFFGTMRQFSAL